MTIPWKTALAVVVGCLAAGAPAHAATHTVRNTEDKGEGSLRRAVDDAANGDMILFASDVRGEIRLGEPLDVDDNVSIKGPGADVVTLAAGSEGSAIDVSGNVSISGLAVTGGESGIDFKHGKLSLIDCSVRSAEGPGIEVADGAKLTLVRTLVAGNRGPGIANGDGTTTCVNSTIADNSGTGIANDGGHVSAASCTIAGNRGPGIDAGHGEVVIQNTLLAGNQPACTGTVTSKGYSLADDGSCQLAAGGDQNDADPRLGSLTSNGGRTLTQVPGAGSPAIDSGDPSGCADPTGSAMLTVDQRGLRRPSGGRCDVGAVETQPATASGTVVDRIMALVDGDPITLYEVKDFASGDPRLREAGAANQSAVLDLLVTKRVIEKEVEAQGIVVQEAEIDRYVANIRQRNNLSEEQLDEALSQQGLTRERYRQQVKEELQRAQLINREIRGKVSVSPEEVARYFKEHEGGESSQDEQVEISHIVLQIPPDASPEQVAEVQARADKIYDELKGGADFGEVAKRDSEDGAAKAGGKLGTFKSNEMREELAKAIEKLDAGEISKPVRTGNAIHIVRLDARIGPGDQAMPDSARDEIKEKLYAEALEERYNRWLKEDLRQRHHVEIRP